MSHLPWIIENNVPTVVGSFGNISDLRETSAALAVNSCDLAEIRLDLIVSGKGNADSEAWAHLEKFPLLFTARRKEEGGANSLGAPARMDLLRAVLQRAALIDIEVASISEMHPLLLEIQAQSVPWIASFHDFEKLPKTELLEENALRAKDAGAAAFKTAAWLATPQDIARLADFQRADHGIPVATMGMGPLAPVSRLLCAQCGSVLNYGYLGTTPTAPGQWDSRFLKQAILKLAEFSE